MVLLVIILFSDTEEMSSRTSSDEAQVGCPKEQEAIY